MYQPPVQNSVTFITCEIYDLITSHEVIHYFMDVFIILEITQCKENTEIDEVRIER